MTASLGLQLYTVRDLIAAGSFAGVVKQVAQLGYRAVETGGFPGTTPPAAAKLFGDLGLVVCSGHFPLPLGDKQNEVLEALATLGCPWLVAGFGPPDFQTKDTIQQIAARCNEASAVLRRQGRSLAVHNHWWEFLRVDGRYAYEILLEHLAPEIALEVDTYWARTAGADPAAELQKIGHRAPLLHIKDGPCQQGEPMTAVGAGRVDFPAIAQATAATAKWWIVELDSCATDMLTAVRQSYQYITSHGFAR